MSPRFDAPWTLPAQLEARVAEPSFAERLFLIQKARRWTYRQYRDECIRCAHFLMQRLGPGARVAILMENHLELLSLYGGCAYAGATLFGVNTGLRGDTLAGVLNGSNAGLLVVGEKFLPQVDRIRGQLGRLSESDILVLPSDLEVAGDATLAGCLAAEVGEGGALVPPDAQVTPETNLMVIYTSGTTGLPKGINNNHFKLLAIGHAISKQLELGPEDRGYAGMPLFHSNCIFLGFQPALHVGASLVVRERFSAGSFAGDVLRHGVSYWNYVGEPVHYVLDALEREFGGDEALIERSIAEHPDNRFRYAIGNGASPPDIDRFMRWLGLEDMFELYGSTEAAMSTFRKKGDPRGSVGEVTDEAVKILNEDGRECPPARLDGAGQVENLADAVGEICRVAPDAALFQGYFDNPEANAQKFRAGVYHSGDLGHIQLEEGRRYLFFDGRTEDWIRKDGENFSAGQVARILQEEPQVALAAAYGVPCPVSDEWVMVALKLRPGRSFDAAAFHDFCERQIDEGGLDPKWQPDFIRIVVDFPYTQTQKILVRQLRAEHYDRRRMPDAQIHWRQRGERGYSPFRASDFEALQKRFVAAERQDLLGR